jgi:hypothetical protein
MMPVLLLGSCETIHYYYQLNEVQPSNPKIVTTEDSGYKYSNREVDINYSFWSADGYVYIKIYNKSRSNIYINLDKSFFVLNGYVNDYYKNESYENTKKSTSLYSKSITGLTYDNYLGNNRATVSKTSENSVTTVEKKKLTIPKKSYRVLKKFYVEDLPFKRCDITLYPKRNEKTVTSEYDIKNSPVVFRNILNYTSGDKIKTIDNKFYISKITNYRKEDFYKPYKIDYCGNIDLSGDGIPFFSPYKFYNKYSDGVGNKFNWSLIKFKTIWGE